MTCFLRLTLYFLLLGLISSSGLYVDAAQKIDSYQQVDAEPVRVEILIETETIQAGHPFWIALHFEIEEHWHAYWKNPGGAGMPPMVDWTLPEGFKVEQMLWPTPKRFRLGSITSFGYEKELVLLAQITPSKSYAAVNAEIQAALRWIVCSDSNCLPGDTELHLTLPVKDRSPELDLKAVPLFSAARAQLPKTDLAMHVERKDGLLTLNFAPPEASLNIKSAEFFSEEQQAINDSKEALLQQNSSSPDQYTLILKENQAQASLKGILVLQTAAGPHSYALDLPIAAPHGFQKEESEIVEINKPTANRMPSTSGEIPPADPFAFQGSFALALLLAFIGGLILNLMPCVLPVISFKILGFVKLAGENRKLIFKHGLAFSLGVLLSFWALATLLMLLQAYGRSVGWGFQLQEPIFVALLASFLFLFGLSLFGLFEIGTGLISAGSSNQHANHQCSALVGSFLSGVLATIVATPCTGPFLGSAVGFAFTLPPLQTLLIFTAIALGMTSPYLALAGFPSLMRFLPSAGAWMVTFKELMGFLLMATVLWLVWVFGAQTSLLAVNLLLLAFFLLAAAGWIYGNWCTPVQRKRKRILGLLSTLICMSAAIYTVTLAASPALEALGGSASSGHAETAYGWEIYSPERVAELRHKGIPVFIDFTAKWCLICQANHLILSSHETVEMFNKLGVVRMKADWTKNDRTITEALRQFGRNSVPLYVLYRSEREIQPRILPQVLTSDIVLSELKQLEQSL